MEEHRKKAFDFAADTTKQLITLSTAIITLTITFSKELREQISGTEPTWMFVAWGAFLLSIIFGIFTMLALTGSLDPMKEKDKPAGQPCLSINAKSVRIPSVCQIMTFVAGIICTVIYGFGLFLE